ncbi:MAG: hydrogenase nickel incorporation protein HypB [Gallionellaceae bacterium]|nr:MAG: hydrogenase nickel incorporation protein HypB [Gallionellaceae bacterium]
MRLFIENVGNLVCPAAFDLGEAAKVVVLSVTEGEDKPLKYPDMFRAAKLMLLNKCDLLPYLSFDVARAEEYARRVNPDIQIIRISATSGEGMQDWLDWLSAQHSPKESLIENFSLPLPVGEGWGEGINSTSDSLTLPLSHGERELNQ